MSKSCSRCDKAVYPTEELKCLDKVRFRIRNETNLTISCVCVLYIRLPIQSSVLKRRRSHGCIPSERSNSLPQASEDFFSDISPLIFKTIRWLWRSVCPPFYQFQSVNSERNNKMLFDSFQF